jgi:hypothetical protein
MDRNALDAVHAHQLGEAFHWNLGCPSDELDQLGQLLLAVFLHHLPEPQDYLVGGFIARVVNIILEILDVDSWHARYQQLQLLGLKEGNALLGDYLMESLKELADLS